MITIDVAELQGVPVRHQPVLYKAMRSATNGQRLVVCLYLMSDLPDARHHLGDIETELRKIFPAASRSRLTPDDYEDFQASAVRFLFNRETKDVKEGWFPQAQRLWKRISRGHWGNTDLGNREARRILRDCGVLLRIKGSVANDALEEIPMVKRRYMEDDPVDGTAADAQADESEELPDEVPSLLAQVDRILSGLPDFPYDRLGTTAGAELNTRGSIPEVLAVVRGVVDQIQAAEARLTLRMNRRGCSVELETRGRSEEDV